MSKIIIIKKISEMAIKYFGKVVFLVSRSGDSKLRFFNNLGLTQGCRNSISFLLVKGQVNGHNVLVSRKFHLSERTK